MPTRHLGMIPSHPGEILRDALDAIDLSKVEVARRLGISRQTLYDILNARMAVTPEMAVRLGALFGNGPASGRGCRSTTTLPSPSGRSVCRGSRR